MAEADLRKREEKLKS